MKKDTFIKRKRKVRAKIAGTKTRPRLTVYRSNKNVYAQLVDDEAKRTVIGLSSAKLSTRSKKKSEISFLLGEEMAKLAVKKGIKRIVFDRSGYSYHGRIKAVAEGARKGGLQF